MQTTLALPAPIPMPMPMPALVAPPEPGLVLDTSVPLMLFGQDLRGKSHGARFVGAEPATVEHAADLMDLFLVAADTDALRDLAAKLPAGRLFASGRAFVPFIKGSLFEQLLAATGTPATPRPVKAASKAPEAGASAGPGQGSGAGGAGAGGPPATRAGAKAPSDHSQIGLGSLVLAQGDEEDDEGFFAAKVIATKAGDSFVLTWVEYPDLPEFARPRKALALLHPEAAGAMG